MYLMNFSYPNLSYVAKDNVGTEKTKYVIVLDKKIIKFFISLLKIL